MTKLTTILKVLITAENGRAGNPVHEITWAYMGLQGSAAAAAEV
jgi:hypothetical protein